jgi:hypothetical protein
MELALEYAIANSHPFLTSALVKGRAVAGVRRVVVQEGRPNAVLKA